MTKRIIFSIIALLILAGAAAWFLLKPKVQPETKAVVPILSVSAFNQNKNADAALQLASAQDVIAYSLRAENHSDQVISGYVIQVDIADVTKNATLLDAGGASFNSETNALVWTPLDISPNQFIERKFIVRLNPNVTNTEMKLKFNNEITIGIMKPTPAITLAPSAVKILASNPPVKPFQAPTTGTSENLLFGLAFLTLLLVIFRKKLAQVW